MLKLLSAIVLMVVFSGAARAQAPAAPVVPGHAQPLPGTENNDASRMSSDDRDARVAVERIARESREGGGKVRRERAVPARAADLVIGAEVRDSRGDLIGTIESVDAGGVQILSGTNRAKLPAEAFGKNRAGLLLDMTKKDFDKAVAASLGGG